MALDAGTVDVMSQQATKRGPAGEVGLRQQQQQRQQRQTGQGEQQQRMGSRGPQPASCEPLLRRWVLAVREWLLVCCYRKSAVGAAAAVTG